MKKNLFEMGADFSDEWSADNKTKSKKSNSMQILKPEQHQLHFAKEKRRGKTVTIVKPFHLKKENLKIVLKGLKKSMGTGGTVKENTLEFQGDIPEKIKIYLETLGYRFKK